MEVYGAYTVYPLRMCEQIFISLEIIFKKLKACAKCWQDKNETWDVCMS